MKSNYILEEKKLLEKVKKKIEDNSIIGSEKYLEEITMKSENYFGLKANFLYLKNNLEEAITLLEEAMLHQPFSFELNYNLAMLELAKGNIKEGFLILAQCMKLAKFDESNLKVAKTNFDECMNVIKDSDIYTLEEKKFLFREAENILNRGNEKDYPIDSSHKSLVNKLVSDSSHKKYFTSLYNCVVNYELDTQNRYFFSTELMPGETKRKTEFSIQKPALVPVATLNSKSDIHITKSGEEKYLFKSNDLSSSQINYLRFEDKGEYNISSQEQFFIGETIPLNDDKLDTQVILNIFIDGLAQTILEENLNKLMPQTYNFFEGGYINTNCRTTGDWTLPSVAAIYTGKTSLNHGIYHPDLDCKVNKYNKIFTTAYKNAGYFTSQINNDWRITPTYGYLQDMDRILYQNYFGGFKVGQVVGETIEHLETFKDKNHFMWISIMDLHDVADGIDNDLMTQAQTNAIYRQQKEIGVTSVLSKYDSNKIRKYEAELKRIDLHLGSLYGYLERTFGKDKIIVSLISDHGQTYLQHDEFLLHEPKRKVPFMLAGKGVPNKISNELSSIIDILPTIAKLTNVKLDSQEGCVLKDFGGEGREISLTETIHPNQPYLVALTDNEHIFRFKTKALTTYNCLIDLEEFTAQLLDINTMEDVSEKYVDKFNKYIDYVIKRASLIQK